MRYFKDTHYLIPLSVLIVSLLLQLFANEALTILQYQRNDIANGQLWRLFSAHLVHLNWNHFFLNAAGLVLLWLLLYRSFSQGQWLLLFFFSLLLIDIAIYFFHPGIVWFAGLSGILHALFTAGAVASIRQYGWKYSAYLVIILVKIAWEQLSGPIPGSTEAIGAPVITASHFYGASAGLIFAALVRKNRLPVAHSQSRG